MWKSSGRRSALTVAKREAREAAYYYNKQRPRPTQESTGIWRSRPCPGRLSPVDDNRLKCKFEAIDVLLQILLHQDELTLKEYTINDRRIKVLVIEDTEF